MCGIVGYISTFDDAFQKEKDHFMHFALTLDTLRGYDSTGMIRVGGDFEVDQLHTVMAGDQWVHTQHYKNNMRKAWAAVGHNRAATRGSVKLENAHPFTFGPVSLVHNGTLYEGGKSLKTFQSNFEVDSMQIAYALSQVPPDAAQKVLEEVDGSFCLVWTDERDKTFNMCRNSDRPMHFGFNAAKTIMFFMSDGTHLASILKSMNKSNARVDSLYSMDRMKHLKFKKGMLAPEIKEFKRFIRPVPPPTKHYTPKRWDQSFKSAINKWRDSAVKKLSLRDVKVKINKDLRHVPVKQIMALRREYDWSPTDRVEFTPDIKYKQKNGRYTVVGTVVHEEWGGCEWDGVIYDVKEVEVNAYWTSIWTVRPVGVSRPFSGGNVTCPSVVAIIEDFDFLRGCHTCDTEEKQEDYEPNVQVGHRLIERNRWDKMLDKGCIQCNFVIPDDVARKTATIVNDGNDLLCGDCRHELEKGGYV